MQQDTYILRTLFGKKLLMPVRRNRLGNDPIVLNDTAAEIWQLAQTGVTEDELIRSVCRKYGLDTASEQAEAVRSCLVQMRELGLVSGAETEERKNG